MILGTLSTMFGFPTLLGVALVHSARGCMTGLQQSILWVLRL